MRNFSGVHRCSICNRVNNEEIETEIGDYTGNLSFTEDPNDPMHFICVDCLEEIQEVTSEWEWEDWENEK